MSNGADDISFLRGQIALENLFACGDVDQDGNISKEEFFKLFLLTDHFSAEEITTTQAVQLAEDLLGRGPEAQAVAKAVISQYSRSGADTLTRGDIKAAIDRHRRRGERGYR